jgi:hypothetical protein
VCHDLIISLGSGLHAMSIPSKCGDGLCHFGPDLRR